jgi:hypothetical protein
LVLVIRGSFMSLGIPVAVRTIAVKERQAYVPWCMVMCKKQQQTSSMSAATAACIEARGQQGKQQSWRDMNTIHRAGQLTCFAKTICRSLMLQRDIAGQACVQAGVPYSTWCQMH